MSLAELGEIPVDRAGAYFSAMSLVESVLWNFNSTDREWHAECLAQLIFTALCICLPDRFHMPKEGLPPCSECVTVAAGTNEAVTNGPARIQERKDS